MTTDAKMEKIISRTLRYGVILSALLMMAGFIAYIFSPSTIPFPANSTPAALMQFFFTQPLHIVMFHPFFLLCAGIIVLLCTPIIRVIVAIVSFALEKDWRYVWISTLVLLIIITSITIASAK